MTIVYVGGETESGYSSTATITHGLTILEGDFVLAYINRNDIVEIGNVTTGEPWSKGKSEQPIDETANHAVYHTVAGASFPATLNFDLGAAADYQVIVKAFRSNNGKQVGFVNSTTDTNQTPSTAFVMGAANGAVLPENHASVIFGGKDRQDNTTPSNTVDNGYTDVVGTGTGRATVAAHKISNIAATITGPITVANTDNATADDIYSMHVVLREIENKQPRILGYEVHTRGADGSFGITVPADATGIFITVGGYSDGGSVGLVYELSLVNENALAFSRVVHEAWYGSQATSTQVDTLFLKSNDSGWQGTGPQTVYHKAKNENYSEGHNILIWYAKDFDLDNPIVDTDHSHGAAGVNPWNSALAGVTASDMHVLPVYRYNGGFTLDINDQTEVVQVPAFNGAALTLAYKYGVSTMTVNSSSTVKTAFALRGSPAIKAAAHWPLDETTGTTAIDERGTYPATLTNFPATPWGNVSGRDCLTFDGVNDQVTAISDAGLRPADLTLGAWVNVDSTGATAWYHVAGEGDNYGINVGWYGGLTDALYFYAHTSNGWESISFSSAGILDTGWHHVGATVDDATKDVKLYLDFAVVATGTLPSSILYTQQNGSFWIGHLNDDRFFKGSIDDVRVYNTALSLAQFSAEMDDLGGGGGNTPVQNSFSLTWNAQNAVEQTNSFLWNALNNIAAQTSVDWDTLNGVLSSRELSWSLVESVNSELAIEWSIFNAVANSLQVDWNALNTVLNNRLVRWNIFNQTISGFTVDWEVLSSLTGVVSTLQTDWSLLQAVTNQAGLDWSILSTAQNGTQLRFNVLNQLSNNLDLDWSLLAAVGSTAQLDWSIEDQLGKVSNSASVSWGVLATISNQLSVQHDVLQAVGVSSELRWDIAQAVQNEIQANWSILQGAENGVSLTWDSIALVNGGLQLAWTIQTEFVRLPIHQMIVQGENRVMTILDPDRIMTVH